LPPRFRRKMHRAAITIAGQRLPGLDRLRKFRPIGPEIAGQCLKKRQSCRRVELVIAVEHLARHGRARGLATARQQRFAQFDQVGGVLLAVGGFATAQQAAAALGNGRQQVGEEGVGHDFNLVRKAPYPILNLGLSCARSSRFSIVMPRACGASSTPRRLDRSQLSRVTGLPAFAGNDSGVGCARSSGGLVMAGLDPAIHQNRKESFKMRWTRGSSPRVTRGAVFCLHKFRRRLAGHLPEGMRKRGDTGITEVGGDLFHRRVGLRRQPLDGSGDTRALTPAFEAQLGLRRKQSRQGPRRGADLAREVVDLMGDRRRAQYDIGGAAATRLLRQRDEGSGILGPVELEHDQLDQQRHALAALAVVEQSEDRLVQQRRDPHHELAGEARAMALALQPGDVEIERAHLDVGEHVDGVRKAGGDPHRAVRRHQPASLRRRHLHGALRSIDQLRLAMQMRIEAGALSIGVGDQMHAVAAAAVTAGNDGQWPLGDSHWRHLVRRSFYNRNAKSRETSMNSPSRVIAFVNSAHFIDHYAMLIFAAAVIVMGPALGMAYSELLPYATPGFVAFGAGSLLTGWLGDRWSRRHMRVIFFIGIGCAMISVGFVQTPLQLGAALLAIGIFASIYHPVGTAMIVSYAEALGREMGLNGVWGNLGVASSALVTGVIGQYLGWRWAFVLPGAITILIGLAFVAKVRHEDRTGTRQAAAQARVAKE